MLGHSHRLQQFFSLAQSAIASRAVSGGHIDRAARKIFASLSPFGEATDESIPSRLPACTHFASAIGHARSGPKDIAELADVLQTLEPAFSWRNRAGSSAGFAADHANAMIVGPNGLLPSSNVQIGVSLLAPGTAYPDHQHPPEEIYLVLSRGDWRQQDGSWREPTIGGLVYNPPNIVHSMRAHSTPLLALWFLWSGDVRLACSNLNSDAPRDS